MHSAEHLDSIPRVKVFHWLRRQVDVCSEVQPRKALSRGFKHDSREGLLEPLQVFGSRVMPMFPLSLSRARSIQVRM